VGSYLRLDWTVMAVSPFQISGPWRRTQHVRGLTVAQVQRQGGSRRRLARSSQHPEGVHVAMNDAEKNNCVACNCCRSIGISCCCAWRQ